MPHLEQGEGLTSRVIDNEDFTNFCALKWNEITYKPVNKGGHKITIIQGLWTKTYGIREGSIPSRLANFIF